MQRTVQTTDGRVLAVEEAGDPAGRPVLVQGGTPGSRLLYGPHAGDAAKRGLRLIGYDRPGYGGSSPQPGRTVADCAADVRAICADLGIGRLAMWGAAGGGPHVLACAALLPDLVVAAATLASLAPFDADGLDYFDGMAPENVDDMVLFLTDEAAARAKTDRDRAEILDEAADDAASAADHNGADEAGPMLPAVDVAAIEGGLGDFFALAMRDGLAPGSEGWWEDNCMIRPWGFSLSDITVPVLLLHGRQDVFVPFGHGQWLAGHIPGVKAMLLDDDGHLSLLANRVPEVHWWLSDHL
ncbi:MAG TPA: alpha/beta fold hydrolase [Trebonia sp.]|nr:alpha/beta fold hydrolase [Trebonia sp.]